MRSRHAKRILKGISPSYPDGFLAELAEGRKVPGDGLATFVAREIQDVTIGVDDESDACLEAMRAMLMATKELMAVTNALQDRALALRGSLARRGRSENQRGCV